jgi:uncharacterized membrane protein
MSTELESQVQDAIEKQGKIWIKVLLIVIAQTVSICAFAFTLRADVNTHNEKLSVNTKRLERLEDNQRDLIRALVIIETLQKQLEKITDKLNIP